MVIIKRKYLNIWIILFSVDKKKTEFGVSASTKTEPKKAPKPVPPKPSKKPGQEEPKFVLKPKDKTVVEGRPF